MSLKTVSTLTIIFFLASQTGCGAWLKQTHVYDARTIPAGAIVFDKDGVYEIKTASYTYKDIKGSQLSWRGDWLIIDSPNGNYMTSFPYADVQKINGQSVKRVKSHWLAGLGIGATAGAAGGTALALSLLNSDGNCGSEDCDMERGIGVVFGAPSILITGSLLGLLIGNTIPKKEKTVRQVQP